MGKLLERLQALTFEASPLGKKKEQLIKQTIDGNRQPVNGGGGLRERCAKAPSRFERFEEVSHHVDLGLFVVLSLAPPHRVVEEVEVGGEEFALEADHLTGVDDVHLSSCQHLDRL